MPNIKHSPSRHWQIDINSSFYTLAWNRLPPKYLLTDYISGFKKRLLNLGKVFTLAQISKKPARSLPWASSLSVIWHLFGKFEKSGKLSKIKPPFKKGSISDIGMQDECIFVVGSIEELHTYMWQQNFYFLYLILSHCLVLHTVPKFTNM